jgi:hypothetical protein
MDVIQIANWNEFVAFTSSHDGWAFRGLQDADWKLKSSLSRYLESFVPDMASWRDREARALRIFRRKAHNYLPNADVLADNLRCLALMQHHGAPTRLLDFTKSPFVAAFFALNQATRDAAVFALDTPTLWRATPSNDSTLRREMIDPRLNDNFARQVTGRDHSPLRIGRQADEEVRVAGVHPRRGDAFPVSDEHHTCHAVSRSGRLVAIHRLRARDHVAGTHAQAACFAPLKQGGLETRPCDRSAGEHSHHRPDRQRHHEEPERPAQPMRRQGGRRLHA